MKRGRKVAVHEVILPDGNKLNMGVVTIVGGCVTDYKTFKGELPMTEWLGGTIDLRMDADGKIKAFKDGAPLI